MRMDQVFALAFLPALGLMACSEQAGQEGTAGQMEMSRAMDPTELRASIESMADRFEAALGAGDAAALAELYAEDATLLPDGAEIMRGREAIGEYWAGFLAEMPAGTTGELETVSVNGAGDLAYEIGRFSLSADGEPLGAGKYLVVWKEQPDGSWKMLADIWNTNESPEM